MQTPFTEVEKDSIYSEINVLENKLYKLALKNKDKIFLVNIINLLQDSIGLLPTNDEEVNQEDAINYLEEHYKEMDIRIYWGCALQFAEELWQRWEEFSK